MKFLVFLFITSLSCNMANDKSAQKPIAENGVKHAVMPDSILLGLEKNYVLHFSDNNKADLLKIYDKTEKEFTSDSLEYDSAVKSFFSLDSTALEVIIDEFSGDTTKCGWIFSPDRYSSKLEPWYISFNKEQGAVILVWSYLNGYKESDKRIVTSPEQIKNIISKIDLNKLREWLSVEGKKSWNMLSLSERFKEEML